MIATSNFSVFSLMSALLVAVGCVGTPSIAQGAAGTFSPSLHKTSSKEA